MAWPSAGYTLSDDQVSAYETWSSVANAIVKYEPVSILVSEQDVKIAREYLQPNIDIIICELNDAWMRDIAPTFVKDVQGNLAAVNWIFNGWGAAKWYGNRMLVFFNNFFFFLTGLVGIKMKRWQAS